MAPAVTVVIPAFNRVGMLREALDSLAEQTFNDFEAIVVDDGSSEDIAARVADHPVHPRVIRQPHRGPAAARNRGIAEAGGTWIAFLDSDDLWLPAKLERYVAEARARPDVTIWYGPTGVVDEACRPLAGRHKRCHAGSVTVPLFQSNFVHGSTVLCRRQAILDTGGFDESLSVCEDYDLWLRLSLRHGFGLIAEPLALLRRHADRLSKSVMHRNLAVKLDMLERFYESHARNGPLGLDAARRRLARVAFTAGRAAWRAGRYAAAVALLAKARQFGAGRSRLFPLMAAATVLRRFARDRPRPAATM